MPHIELSAMIKQDKACEVLCSVPSIHNQYASANGNLLLIWSIASLCSIYTAWAPRSNLGLSIMSTNTIVFPIFPQDKERAMPGHFNPKVPVEIPREKLSSHELTCSEVLPGTQEVDGFCFPGTQLWLYRWKQIFPGSTILIFSLRDCYGDGLGLLSEGSTGKKIKSFLYMSNIKARHTSKSWHHLKVALGCSWSHLSGMGALFIFVKRGPGDQSMEHGTPSKGHQC